ncbi:MAG: accessory gene regulator B family protein [Oscillospiraceae bacterium]|nr:accessory gene regulator B family protein [Oscillospiraceae bacterium]
MIDKLSNSVLGYLLNKEVIRNEKVVKEYYKYGIEITISSIISLFLIFLIGAGTNCIFEGLVFLVFFIPIRQYTGGYHANTYFKCNLSMCIIFSSVMMIYKNVNCNMQVCKRQICLS